MWQNTSPRILKITVLSAGLLGLLLRLVLLQTGVDEKGLLITGHWADYSSWLLTAGVIGLIFLSQRNRTGPADYSVAFPASPVRSVGSLIAAFGFLLSGAPDVMSMRLAAVETLLRFLSAAALVAVAYCRFLGKKPSFLFHGIACLYLALRMICRYQLWSSDPQLQHYAFYLGAHVALMLGSYQLAAFDTDCGNHRSLWCWGLGAVYLCLTAIPGSNEPFFLLCCALWAFTGLSNPLPHEGD